MQIPASSLNWRRNLLKQSGISSVAALFIVTFLLYLQALAKSPSSRSSSGIEQLNIIGPFVSER